MREHAYTHTHTHHLLARSQAHATHLASLSPARALEHHTTASDPRLVCASRSPHTLPRCRCYSCRSAHATGGSLVPSRALPYPRLPSTPTPAPELSSLPSCAHAASGPLPFVCSAADCLFYAIHKAPVRTDELRGDRVWKTEAVLRALCAVVQKSTARAQKSTA